MLIKYFYSFFFTLGYENETASVFTKGERLANEIVSFFFALRYETPSVLTKGEGWMIKLFDSFFWFLGIVLVKLAQLFNSVLDFFSF